MFVFGEALSPLKLSKKQCTMALAIMDYNATVTKISRMLVIGDALSPLKLSKKKAKL